VQTLACLEAAAATPAPKAVAVKRERELAVAG